MKQSGIIFSYDWTHPTHRETRHTQTAPQKTRRTRTSSTTLAGIGMIMIALGGLAAPFIPRLLLDTKYQIARVQKSARAALGYTTPEKEPTVLSQTDSKPAYFNPLIAADGSDITPVNEEFSLVIPDIGVNSPIIASVNPTNPGEYKDALLAGVAHSSLSYFPDQDGTVYLFSHSTNYEWWVKDLNAVFYLLKNLESDDIVVIVYKGVTYTYKITEKRVVKPTAVAYLVPQAGAKRLILQTCWPPGSTTERLLIFADLIQDSSESI